MYISVDHNEGVSDIKSMPNQQDHYKIGGHLRMKSRRSAHRGQEVDDSNDGGNNVRVDKG